MNPDDISKEISSFIEDFGIIFEKWGLPRMAGRVLAWLLICDPPHQDAAQLAEAVGASKGSISTTVRLLEQYQFIERVGIPGERSTFYRVKPDGCVKLLKAKIGAITAIRELVERGLELLLSNNEQARSRLNEMKDFYSFFEMALPIIIEQYEKEREGK